MITLESVVLADTQQVSSDMGDQVVILSLSSDTYFSLDAASAFVWNLIQEPKSVREIRDAVETEFEIGTEQCTSDVITFVTELAAKGLVDIQNGQAD